MEANLTRYTCFLRDDGHSIAALMVPSDTGEYVKFADIKESLSKSHNTGSPKFFCCLGKLHKCPLQSSVGYCHAESCQYKVAEKLRAGA